jgi:hypothetical protein
MNSKLTLKMKNILNTFLHPAAFLFFLLNINSNLFSQQWPIAPQNQQHSIAGTVGEDRGGQTRWHKGTDVSGSSGTNVLAIEGGTFNALETGNEVCVGTYCFTHVIPNPNLTDGVSVILAGDIIGTIQQQTNQHIHLQRSDANTINITVNAYNNDNVNWINPLNNGLTPFQDNIDPEIDGVSLWRNGVNNQPITGPLLYGEVDIMVNVEDPRVNEDGGNGGGGCAPYSINWEVVDVNNNVIRTFDGIMFDQVPQNYSAPIIFGPNTNFNGNPANFEY